MGKAAAAGHILQPVIALEPIAGKVSGKPFQKFLRVVSSPAGLVVIQADQRQPIVPGAIQPHIGPGLCRFPILLQHLAGRFVRMDDSPLQQMFVKPFIYRLHVIHAAFDDPVGQCRPPQLYAHLLPVRLLPVKRDAVHIFLVHHVSSRGRGREAVLQQGAGCFGFNDNGSAVFLTFRAAEHFLDVLDPLHLCAGDPQFFPHHLFPDHFHRGIAVRTVPVSLRHCAGNLDYRKPRQDFLPGSLRFSGLTVITADCLLQGRLRGRRVRGSFCLIEQIHLSGEFILFGFFTG